MLTAKDIREVKFNRAMGGYKTIEVDEFLDRCADVVEELTAQCEENERKMQVLAETIVDYRNQEDSIRSALISAQRMSESVIAEARKQAEDIRDAARADAENMREKAAAEITAELEELRRIKQEVADFKAKLLATYREHLTLIGILDSGSSNESTPPAAESNEAAEPAVEPVIERHVPHNLPDFSSLELIET